MRTNKFIFGAVALAILACAASANAEEKRETSVVGLGFDLGAPDGMALGVVAAPLFPWMKLELAGTYNYISEGIRGSATLDPFRFPVGLTLTGDYGGYFAGTVPGVAKSPTLSYTYENILLGLEFGSRNGFRFFLRGGLTHLNLDASGFNHSFTLPTGTTIGTAHTDVWAAPACKLGFTWMW